MGKCIVILSFNHPELTSRTVQSSLQFNLPIILIHNGSLSKNVQILKERFPQIDHYVMNENKGYTGGVNCGLGYAFKKYEWVLFLTNDTELIAYDFDRSEPAFLAPLIYFRKLERIDSMGGIFTPYKAKLRHIKSELDKLSKGDYFYVPGTAFMIHKRVFESVGYFDESLGTYWEDVDFSVRAIKLKFQVEFDSSVKILHRVGKTCHDNPFYTTYLFRRNRKRISLRHSSFLSKTILVPLLLSDSVKTFYKFLIKKDFYRLKLAYKALVD